MRIFIVLFVFGILTVYSQVPEGEVIESFENTAEWTFEGDGVYNSANSVHSDGSSAILLGTTVNERSSMTRTISLNFNDYKTFSIDVYTPDFSEDNRRSIRIELTSSPTFSQHLRVNLYAGHKLHIGWTRLYFSKEDFSDGYGNESWSNTMVRVKFSQWTENAGDYTPGFITFDNFRGYRIKPPAIAIISFDDNEKSSVTVAKPILDALGFKAVQFVIGSTADQNLSNWLSWSDYDTLYQQGWDISNHTYTHPRLSTLDASSLDLEINGMRDLLLSHGYTRSCDFIAYPYSDYSSVVLDKVREHNKMARGAEDWNYTAHPSSVLNDYYLIRVQSEWDDLSVQLADIDKAIERGQLLVYMFHDVSSYVDRFSSTMQHLKAKQNAGEIQVMTFSEYWNYLHAIAPGVTVNAKVYLQGAYNSSTGLMTTNLNVPVTSPYPDHRSVAAVPSGVVDWLYLELRTSATGPAVAVRSVFLKSDGSVADDNGSSGVSFQVPPGYYYVVLRHRNHLGVMSSVQADLSSSSVYDFTTALNKAYTTGANPMAALPDGKFGMIAGDTDGNEVIDHASDIMLSWYPEQGHTGYINADFNLNGTVDFNNDIPLWLPNFGFVSQVPGTALHKASGKQLMQEVRTKYGFESYSRSFNPEKEGEGCQDYYLGKKNAAGAGSATTELQEKKLPKDFTISRNYPNPFNPVTNISYTLKEDAVVTMILYNSLGQKVQSVMNQSQGAGYYTKSIDGSQLANGTYMLNVTIKGSTEVKNETIKLMLLK
jgi:peptidoglycan/xylan/chitin deacetylase (PgdA/CDA1 family)